MSFLRIKSGLCQNQSEVVRDALRLMFLEDDFDDTELLAEKLREAKDFPPSRSVRGEFRKVVAGIAEKRRQKKAA